MNSTQQFFFHHAAASAAHLTSVVPIDLNHPSSGTFSLIQSQFNQFAPRRIANAFSETRVLYHVRAFQFLERDDISEFNIRFALKAALKNSKREFKL